MPTTEIKGPQRYLPSFGGRNGIDPTEHIGMVVALAKKCGARPPYRDSEQFANGLIGLLKAADRFDPTMGCKFSTYAQHWILQAIWRPKQMERTQSRGAGKIRTVCASQLGEADRKRPLSNDFAVDRLPQVHEQAIDREEANSAEALSAGLLKFLGQRDERIVRRYVMNGLTLEQVGDIEGVTRERIRQIVNRSLRKMRAMAQRTGIADRIELMEVLER